MRAGPAVLVALLLLGPAPPASARRLPADGGSATVAVPDALREATIEAHTTVPLLEPIPAEASMADRLARPALPGRPLWRSAVLLDLRPSDDYVRWTLSPAGPPEAVVEALSRCLGPSWWAGRALAGAGVSSTVRVGQDGIEIVFEAPVGPVPELLAACPVSSPGGPWTDDGDGTLTSRGDGRGLLDRVVVAELLADADVAAGDPTRPATASLTTRAPDVLLLLQDAAARAADPLTIAAGAEAVRDLLAPDLLLAVFWGGRGAATTGILPPGLAPSRPRSAPGGPPPPELRIDPLPPSAPRLGIAYDRTDDLVAGTVERLAVLLRSHGWALDPGGAAAGASVVRWRPPTLDPALALLALAGAHPDLLGDVRLSDPALLDPDPDRRFAGVTELELSWIGEGRVLPLMTADRWITMDPDLRGVRLRPDGVPLLHDAWWSVPR